MRLNKFLALNTGLSRRKADIAIENGRVKVNGDVAALGTTLFAKDVVLLDGTPVEPRNGLGFTTLLIHKPVGYVCSRNGQGNKTIYDLLPGKYAELNTAGRLDKDSSGLVILTNDGDLLNELTHPSNNKLKIYKVIVDKVITPSDRNKLLTGVDIGDERPSKFKFLKNISNTEYEVVLEEGRNRQIRRSFEALGYKVTRLHREKMGKFSLGNIKEKDIVII
jgi:23S rRNA pseudouridine2605 synthase